MTQKHRYGCAIACLSSVSGLPYGEVAKRLKKLGRKKIDQKDYYCKELVRCLEQFDLTYTYKYLKPQLRRKTYQEGMIVYIKKSKKYPAGHYLARHEGSWMDPWINLVDTKDINEAKSGFRKRLPGRPIYAIFFIGQKA